MMSMMIWKERANHVLLGIAGVAKLLNQGRDEVLDRLRSSREHVHDDPVFRASISFGD